jgi:hypothetical protein
MAAAAILSAMPKSPRRETFFLCHAASVHLGGELRSVGYKQFGKVHVSPTSGLKSTKGRGPTIYKFEGMASVEILSAAVGRLLRQRHLGCRLRFRAALVSTTRKSYGAGEIRPLSFPTG